MKVNRGKVQKPIVRRELPVNHMSLLRSTAAEKSDQDLEQARMMM